MNRLREFFLDLRETFGDQILQRFRDGETIQKFATAHNIDIEDLMKDDEEVAQENQASQESALMEKAVGPVAGQLAGGVAAAANQQ